MSENKPKEQPKMTAEQIKAAKDKAVKKLEAVKNGKTILK